MNGIINVNKPKGITSHDVIYKLRKILKQKSIGHTGTLDPDAQGVLPICIGNATKASNYILNEEKRYTAELKLGIITDTQDISGKVLETKEVSVNIEDVKRVVERFVGKQNQIPPMYSAIKVNGKKLYELARAGIEIEREPRPIEISELNLLNIQNDLIKIDCKCSKGTYIRTLCHDIGQALGCGATMTELTRTQAGIFNIESSYTLEDIEIMAKDQKIEEILIKVENIFKNYDKIILKEEQYKLFMNGATVKLDKKYNIDFARIYDLENKFIALGKLQYNLLKVEKFFLE